MVSSGAGSTVQFNEFVNNTAWGGNAAADIYIENSTNGLIQGNLIRDTDGASGLGIQFFGSGTTSGYTATDNSIYNKYYAGVLIQAPWGNNTNQLVTRNLITGSSGLAGAGILVENTSYTSSVGRQLTFSKNAIYGNTGVAIDLQPPPSTQTTEPSQTRYRTGASIHRS